jgi:uracil-DNA glycosylase
LALLPELQVVIVLGQFAYDVVAGWLAIRPRPRFGHGVQSAAPNGMTVICSFHPSQQNTFTGKLTEAMLDSVLAEAAGASA